MYYRRYGRTNLQVSVVGLGSGGPSSLGQKTGVSESESQRVVRRALELGVNLIDTGEGYGDSEEILGRGLDGVPRASYVLCTKFNTFRPRNDPRRVEDPFRRTNRLGRSLPSTRSLRRLRTDYVDVYQFHNVHPDEYPAIRDRFVPELRRQQAPGKVRFIGVTERFSNDHTHAMLTAALADDLWDSVMVGYNLLTPSPEGCVLPEAARRDVGVLVMCAVRRVIADPDKLAELIRSLKAAGVLPPEAVADTDPLGWLVHDDVESLTSAAYRFAAAHPAVSSVLTGTGSVRHLEQNVDAVLRGPLPVTDQQRLRALFGPIKRNLGEGTGYPDPDRSLVPDAR